MSVRIKRIRNRVYEPGYYVDEETGERCDVRRLKANAEYAVVRRDENHGRAEILARLKRNNGQ